MGPPIFNVMPRWLLELLTNMATASEEKKVKGGDVSMRALAPTLHYDGQLVVEMSVTLESFRAIRAEVLLLGGSKSPAYLKVALDALEKVLPYVKRIEFLGPLSSTCYNKHSNKERYWITWTPNGRVIRQSTNSKWY